MKRREFMQMLAATGMTASLPLSIRSAHAAPELDQFYVMINASGGWDPTSFCDPKGINLAYASRAGAFSGYDGSVNRVALDENKRIGDIRWSAIPGDPEDTTRIRVEGQYDNFFQKFGDRMVVINGLDIETNSHSTGNMNTWSGEIDGGYPCFAAVYAGAVGPNLPMSFISNGGYDETANLVARARANNASYLSELADPNRRDSSRGYLYRTSDQSLDLYDKVQQAQQARIARQQAAEGLPLRRRQISQLFSVRSSDNNLGALKTHIDTLNADLPLRDTNDGVAGHMNARGENLKRQGQVAAAAFKAGLSASVMLNTGSFDTHGNHDGTHYRNIGDMLEGMDYLMEALDLLGVAEKTTIVMASDFGRTPYYNSGIGKDHWPVSSMITLHPKGVSTGGKVFGASSEEYRPLAVNPTTGQADENGVVITPAHVHRQLRRLAGVENSAAASSFPMAVEDINLFNFV